MKVKVYGTSKGYWSFARVTSGMLEGLRAHDAFAGFYAVDRELEDNEVGGETAPVAVFAGPPALAPLMISRGDHATRLVLLPPNSTWMPFDLLRKLEQVATGFVAPSHWAATQMARHTKHPIHLWPHGVALGFIHRRGAYLARRADFSHGEFRVLHMSSSRLGRKGTRELIQAWAHGVDIESFGPKPELHLVHDMLQVDVDAVIDDASRGSGHIVKTFVCHTRLPKMTPENASSFYQRFHAVAQPSRGEGFGLVPLEARASGVPVVMTTCTGHLEHSEELFHQGGPASGHSWPFSSNGVVACYAGQYRPVDDGPDACAPSLDPMDVLSSLTLLHDTWSDLSAEAFNAAGGVQDRWSWGETTKKFLMRLS